MKLSKRSAIIDYPKKMYEEISAWAEKVVKDIYYKEKKIVYDKRVDNYLRTLREDLFMVDTPAWPNKIAESIVEVLNKIATEPVQEQYVTNQLDAIVNEANKDSVKGSIHFPFPYIDRIIASEKEYDIEDGISFEVSRRKKKFIVSLPSPKWINQTWKMIRESLKDINIKDFNGIHIGLPNETKVHRLNEIASVLGQYGQFVEYMKSINGTLGKLSDVEEALYNLSGPEQKIHPAKAFEVDLSDTEQYKKHDWLRKGLAIVEQGHGGPLKLGVYFLNDKDTGAGADYYKGKMRIFNVKQKVIEDEWLPDITEDVNRAIKHELVHMIQDIMTKSLSKIKNLVPGKYYAGLPGPYKPEGLQMYGPAEEDRAEYGKQHALSDIEFYSRIQDEIAHMVQIVGRASTTSEETEEINAKLPEGEPRVYEYTYLADLPPELKNLILNGRFQNFIRSSQTLSYFRKHDRDKFNRMVRELYRVFSGITKSAGREYSWSNEELRNKKFIDFIRANQDPEILKEAYQKFQQRISKRAKEGSLKKYKSIRDFKETSEPEGKTEKGKNQHRFVIQDHKATHHHWDLRLENDQGSLSSWSIPKHKLPRGKERLLAISVEDHPISYMHFSGKIPEGEYGAGSVKIHDSGKYVLIKWDKDTIKFALNGRKEKETYTLRRTDDKKWIIMVGDDEEKSK